MRVIADAVSPESMTRVGAGEDGVGDVARLGARGARSSTIDCSISVATMTGALQRGAPDLLWMTGTRSAELHAEIAARHHDAVGGGDDLSRFSTASGVSIFAMTGVGLPHAWHISRTRRMSSARLTNESAT